jgi:predicted DNA-binding transcriptional regulator AlpA
MLNNEMIGTSQLCKRYDRGRNTLQRWQKTKNFPKPIIQGGHGAESRWLESDIMAWESRQSHTA